MYYIQLEMCYILGVDPGFLKKGGGSSTRSIYITLQAKKKGGGPGGGPTLGLYVKKPTS